MLSPKQQAFDLLNKSQNVLIPLPQSYSADALGAALALANLCQGLNKKTEIIASELPPPKLAFLPGVSEIKNEPTFLRDFIISIDTSQNKIKRLRYEDKNSVLKIFLTSQGKLEEKNIRLEPGPLNFDLIVTIDSSDFEALGPLYDKNTELFFAKPILNIDYRSANEQYGQVNLIEPTASSSCEILTDFFNFYFPGRINEPIATALLTGIIEETNSFQKPQTTPQTFNLASLLITQGAQKEKIIQALYKTKPLNFLKLWGRLLSQLVFETEKNIAWLEAQPEDFEQTQTSAADLPMIADEVFDLLPQTNACVVLWRDASGQTAALIQSKRLDLLQNIHLELSGSLKNHRLFVKSTLTDLDSFKSQLRGLLVSCL